MKVQFQSPAKELAPLVAASFYLDDPDEKEAPLPELIPPVLSGGLSLTFRRKAPIIICNEWHAWDPMPEALVVPAQSKAYQAVYPGATGMLGFHFLPGAFYELFGWPMHEVTDRLVELELLGGRSRAAQLKEEIAESVDAAERIRLLERFILPYTRERHTVKPIFYQALQDLEACRGKTNPYRWRRQLGISERHLRRLFNEYAGIPPRTYLRIYRFFQVLQRLIHRPPRRLSELPEEFGYTDLAHLSSEFSAFSGKPPSQYLQQRQILGKAFRWEDWGG